MRDILNNFLHSINAFTQVIYFQDLNNDNFWDEYEIEALFSYEVSLNFHF